MSTHVSHPNHHHDSDADRERYIALLLRLGQRAETGRFRQIFCNRDLDQARVRWIGFDMDHTLAVYHRREFDELCHKLTLQRLVEQFGQPAECLSIPFRHDFAIRGLTLDKAMGNILKIDAHRNVERAVHGFRRLTFEELEPYRKMPPDMSLDRFVTVDTLFELPETYIFAAVVDLLERRQHIIDFAQLADQVRSAVDSIHRDGTLKAIVTADLPRYIRRERQLGATLHRLRSAGKRLFLMTNSFAEYTDSVMAYLLENGPVDYKDWRGYFEVIVTGANKPAFFRSSSPFLKLGPSGLPIGEASTRFERGTVYQHGNLRDFERMTGARADEVLYVGDHIYGDILRSKVDSAWRTVMIIPELEAELATLHAIAPLLSEWNRLEADIQRVKDAQAFEAELCFRANHPEDAAWVGTDEEKAELTMAVEQIDRHSDDLVRRRKIIVEQLRAIEREVDQKFHPDWGALLKAGNEHSIFGEQVETFADLYTSRVSNLYAYSPVHYHRSPRTRLPHEIAVEASAQASAQAGVQPTPTPQPPDPV